MGSVHQACMLRGTPLCVCAVCESVRWAHAPQDCCTSVYCWLFIVRVCESLLFACLAHQLIMQVCVCPAVLWVALACLVLLSVLCRARRIVHKVFDQGKTPSEDYDVWETSPWGFLWCAGDCKKPTGVVGRFEDLDCSGTSFDLSFSNNDFLNSV